MSDSAIKLQLQADMKEAMRAQARERLSTIRLALAAIKQKEVDERVTLADGEVIAIIDKMIKQRRDSIQQFEAAGRNELAAHEAAEIEVLKVYLPQALSEAEVKAIILAAMAESGAKDIKDLGKVMAIVKPKVQGRCDMGAVSSLIKSSF